MVETVLALLFGKSYQYVIFSDRHAIHTNRRHRTCVRCTKERPNTQAFNMKSYVLFENRNLCRYDTCPTQYAPFFMVAYCVGRVHKMLSR